MAKTKLLLAFGVHGDQIFKFGPDGVKMSRGPFPPDTKFFRSAIMPFLEEYVVKEGRKAALIYEGCLPLFLKLGYPGIEINAPLCTYLMLKHYREEILKLIGERVIKSNLDSESFAREIFDKGFPGTYAQGSRELQLLEFMSLNTFGIEGFVIGLNKAKPDTVRLFMEPQDAEEIYISKLYEALGKYMHGGVGGTETLTEYIKLLIEDEMGRDRRIAGLADHIAAENPGIAIIIPRGRRHAPMEVLFDKSAHDISLHIGRGDFDFTIDAITRSYSEALTKAELLLYAKLQFDFNHALGCHGDYSSVCAEYSKKYNISLFEAKEKILLEARAYAITKNPEIAKELGIRE